MFSHASIGCRVLLGGLVLSAMLIQAEDWAQWRGPDRSGQVPASWKVPQTLATTPKVLWRVKAGEGFSSPVVAQGKLYFSDNVAGKETLHALDATSGKALWSATIDDTFKDSQGPPGPRCTPLVDGRHVFAQSCKGELKCLDTADGKVIWHVNYTNDLGAVFIGEKGNTPGASRHGYNGAPVIEGDSLVACVGGTNGAGVVRFNKKNGQVIWKSQNDQAAYAPPIIATVAGTKQAICFMADALIGLDYGNGRLLWRVPIKTDYARHVTIPVVLGDLVVVGSHTAGLIATRISREGAVFTAEQAWVNQEAAMNFSSPVLIGQQLYGLGPKKNIVCVDLPSGRTVWSREGYINTSADKAHAAFLVMGKNLLISNDSGELILLQVSGAEPKELGRVQVCGLNWSNPAYANGRLYLRDGLKAGGGELLAIELVP